MIKPQDIAKGYFKHHTIPSLFIFFRPQDFHLGTLETGERGPQETQEKAFVSFEESRGLKPKQQTL